MLAQNGSMMTNKEKIRCVLSFLDELYPESHCELIRGKDYEFLISVVLSAQATDKSVNLVTPVLFKKYDSLEKLSNASQSDIESIIKSVGLYKTKAKNINALCTELCKRGGAIPNDEKFLLSLPGVGIKTKNVFLAEVYAVPHIAVDTHVSRVAKRLGFAKQNDEPAIIETKLEKIIEPERYIKTHHQFISFGRYFCKAKNPNCRACKISAFCKK